MKKRILSFIFVLVMVLCIGALCACDLFGGADDSGKYTVSEKDKEEKVNQDIYAVYQLYLSNGGKLTYDEWLATIKGEKGDKGDQGLRGEKGDKGDQGVQGEKGSDGLTPFIGENGNWWIGTTDTGTPATSTGGGTADNVFFIGKCGENVTWTMYKDGRLVITGEGEMDLSRPWLAFAQLITDVTIEEGITSVIDWAFEDCTSVERVDIPDSVTSIGYQAFFNCTSLMSITIPDSVTSIGGDAFYNCTSLTSVYYTGDIASWCGISFGFNNANPLSYAHNLYVNNELVTDLVIPNGVTEIKNYAFYVATCLKSVTIPDSVTSIGVQAFYECTSLTSVYYTGDIASWCGITFGSYNANPLYYAHNLYIGNVLVTDLVIPNGVTEIKDYAFAGATCLTNIVIPDSVTSIGESAFRNCTALTSVTIPAGVTSIGVGAFNNCTALTSVYYTGDIASWCGITFGGVTANPLSYAHNLYINNELVTDLVIPNGVTEIKYYAFAGASFGSVTIPDSVTIGVQAFYECTSLTSIYVGTLTDNAYIYYYLDVAMPEADLGAIKIYYYSETEPETSDYSDYPYYWHYDTDGETILVWGE